MSKSAARGCGARQDGRHVKRRSNRKTPNGEEGVSKKKAIREAQKKFPARDKTSRREVKTLIRQS